MSLLVHGSPDVAKGFVGSLRFVATAGGRRPFTGPQADLVRAMTKVLPVGHETERGDLDLLLEPDEPWSHEQAAVAAIRAWLPEPQQRRETMHAALLVAMDSDEPDRLALGAAHRLAVALGADDQTIRDVEATSRRSAAQAEADLYRRFLSWKTGIDEVVIAQRLALHQLPVITPASDVTRFGSLLAEGQEGSVAAELARFYVETDFNLPGSTGTLPFEVLGSHDVHHVLAAYGADLEDEVYLGAFTAANSTEGGMDYLAVIMLQWHQGIRVGFFDPDRAPLDPQLFAEALERGAQTTVDLSGKGIDYFDIVTMGLAEARAELGIPAGGRVGPGDPWIRDSIPLRPPDSGQT